MQQNFATVSSSGGLNASPWKMVDWMRNPCNLGLAVYSSGGSYWVDVTLEDPTGQVARPSSATAFNSSAVGSSVGVSPTGVFLSSLAAGGGIGAGTASALGVITQPISAWRLVSNSTTAGGLITAIALQSGPR